MGERKSDTQRFIPHPFATPNSTLRLHMNLSFPALLPRARPSPSFHPFILLQAGTSRSVDTGVSTGDPVSHCRFNIWLEMRILAVEDKWCTYIWAAINLRIRIHRHPVPSAFIIPPLGRLFLVVSSSIFTLFLGRSLGRWKMKRISLAKNP